MTSVPTAAAELSSLLDAELNNIVGSRDMPLYDMMSYHMGWADRRGHPTDTTPKERTHGVLCLLAASAVGGDIETAMPAAAAIELVSSFCEIHDDVQGGNPARDNRDAVWWVWGPAQAINAGDGMHALARLALFRLLERGVSSATTFRAVQLLDESSLQSCEGRFLELEAQERIDMSVEAYMEMAASKSGSLLSCAMKLGPAVHQNESILDAFGRCGKNLGVAVQINADIKALWTDGDDGKPSPDVLNKTKLLPVVYALERATISEKRALGEIYFKRVLDGDDVVKVRKAIDEMGVRDECEALVAEHRDEAVAALDAPEVSDDGRARIVDYIDSLIG